MFEKSLIVLAALAAILWVNWYFFIAGREPAKVTPAGDSAASNALNSAVITVDGGYSPATVRVRAGAPMTLMFDRKDTSSCSEEIVFPDFSIRRYLPHGKRTTIELPAAAAGRYEFMCGMSMLRGTLIVEEGGA